MYDFGVLAMMGLVINNYLFRRNNIQQQQSLKTLGHSVPTPRTAPSARASPPNSWWDFQSCNTSDSCPPHSPLSRPTSPGHIIYMDLGRSLLPALTPSWRCLYWARLPADVWNRPKGREATKWYAAKGQKLKHTVAKELVETRGPQHMYAFIISYVYSCIYIYVYIYIYICM